MGFGSYDESEQGKHAADEMNMDEEEEHKTEETKHDGEVEYEGMENTEKLLTRLQEIKEE